MPYLRKCWYVAGFPDEVTSQPFCRTFLDEPVVLYRTADDTLVAMDDRCPHRFASLSEGSLVGEAIQCPYHGLRFGPDGRCVHLPGGGEPPPRARARVYPLVASHGLLWIWMGDPVRADVTLIPDMSYADAVGHTNFTAYLHAKGHYELVVDNLLDLSHIEFLHPMLASDGWRGSDARVRQEGDTVFVTTTIEDDAISPLVAQLRPDLPPRGITEQVQRWDAPGILELRIGYTAGGETMQFFGGHCLTPETQGTTHYFLRAGQNIGVGQPELVAQIKAGVTHIFDSEDLPIIERQQRNLAGRDLMQLQPAILKGDAGAVRVRRILAKRIREEQAETKPHRADAA